MSNIQVSQPNFPTASDFQVMKELGRIAVNSGFLPTSINTPEKAVVIMLKGRELGIGPMEAFSKISVIQGKPTMDAELMLSLIFKRIAGAVVNFLESDNTKCTIEAKRPGGKLTTFSFTIEDAQRAQLTSKHNWKTFPAAMLRARTIAIVARAIFPDAISGISYTPEELGAVVDEEGNVVDIPTAEAKPVEKDVTPKAQESDTAPKPRLDASPGDLGEYVMPVGRKYRGKKLKDIDIYELDNYVVWLRETAKEPPTGLMLEFLTNADAYIASREVKPPQVGDEQWPA